MGNGARAGNALERLENLKTWWKWKGSETWEEPQRRDNKQSSVFAHVFNVDCTHHVVSCDSPPVSTNLLQVPLGARWHTMILFVEPLMIFMSNITWQVDLEVQVQRDL